MESSDEIFNEQKPVRYNFDGHTVVVILPAGGAEYPTLKVQCHEADKDDSACTSRLCQLDDLWRSIGWEVIKAAGEIELARLSARADWSDPEEPWIEVEP